MRQRVSQNVTNRFLQFSAAGEISALVGGIAPASVLVPVPRRHAELGVVAIRDRAPARRKRFLDDMRRINFIDVIVRQNVNRAAESAVWVKGINGVARSDIHVHGGGLASSPWI